MSVAKVFDKGQALKPGGRNPDNNVRSLTSRPKYIVDINSGQRGELASVLNAFLRDGDGDEFAPLRPWRTVNRDAAAPPDTPVPWATMSSPGMLLGVGEDGCPLVNKTMRSDRDVVVVFVTRKRASRTVCSAASCAKSARPWHVSRAKSFATRPTRPTTGARRTATVRHGSASCRWSTPRSWLSRTSLA